MESKEKLWIFQSVRELSKEEQDSISKELNSFLATWDAHEVPMKAKSETIDNRFIIVIADENHTKASGCSMDKLNKKIREIDGKYELGLLNRFMTSYEIDNKIYTEHISKFKEKVRTQKLSENTIVYNISLDNMDLFSDNFKKPLKESWAKIYLN